MSPFWQGGGLAEGSIDSPPPPGKRKPGLPLGILIAVLPPTVTLSSHLEVEIGESLEDWNIRHALVTACVFSRRARTTVGVVSCKFSAFTSALAKGGGAP